MSVTSFDVAKAAGVSRATVSIVLNDAPGRVGAATRETVLRVARELGYQPSALGRSLRRGRSNTVLFPLPGVEMNHAVAMVLDACTQALAPRGLSLVRDTSVHADPAARVDAWAELAPAAVLDLALHRDDPALAELRARGIPVLSAALPDVKPWESSGDVFAREQRMVQLEHLLATGRRRIRCVFPRVLPVDPRTERSLFADARTLVASAGGSLSLERLDLVEIGAAVAGWTRLPDAVAAHNDTWAVAVMTALQHRGQRIPDDVAVIGADDEPLGRAVSPTLTTVSGEYAAFATGIADAVEAVLSGKPAKALPVPDVRLHHRGST